MYDEVKNSFIIIFFCLLKLMLRRALGCIETKKVGNHNDYQPFCSGTGLRSPDLRIMNPTL